MKANELIIKDWVYSAFAEHPCQVEGIEWTESGYAFVKISGVNGYKCIESLSPIPLTKEIIMKNGWVYNNEDEKFFPQTWVGGGLMLRPNILGYRVVVISDYDDEDTNDTPFIILYVHELQHALRMCNINKTIEL